MHIPESYKVSLCIKVKYIATRRTRRRKPKHVLFETIHRIFTETVLENTKRPSQHNTQDYNKTHIYNGVNSIHKITTRHVKLQLQWTETHDDLWKHLDQLSTPHCDPTYESCLFISCSIASIGHWRSNIIKHWWVMMTNIILVRQGTKFPLKSRSAAKLSSRVLS